MPAWPSNREAAELDDAWRCCFYESSTRTRTSFELAAKSRLARYDHAGQSDKSSSIEKGESLKDTGLTLRALGAECDRAAAPGQSGAPFVLARAHDRTACAERRRRNAPASFAGSCWICARWWRGCRALQTQPGRRGDAAHWRYDCDYRRHPAQPRGAFERNAASAPGSAKVLLCGPPAAAARGSARRFEPGRGRSSGISSRALAQARGS